MSIFKDTFKQGVQNQLKARQEAITERTPTAIQYYNARNAWIRMTSAVNVNGSDSLAKQYILLGGTINNNGTPKSGVGNTTNNAYSTVTPGGETNRLGIRPMPGITGIEVKSKSAYGSLREVTVNFNAWDIRQLEDLELLYMRPGYSVLVEWGWAPYLTNSKTLGNTINFNDSVLNGNKSKENIWKEIHEKAAGDGNYDALYGFIKNYSWSARDDGGYDCTVTVISIGEILESLKVNYGAYDSGVNSIGIFGQLETPFAKDSTVYLSYSQNLIAGICNELYLILKNKEGIGNYEEKTISLTSTLATTKCTFFRFDLDIEGSENDTADNDFDDNQQIYILLKDFIEILNKHVLIKDIKNQTPLVKVSVNEGAHMGGENEPLQCLAHRLQLSVDPSICLIKNDLWQNPESQGLNLTDTFFDANDFSTLKNLMEGMKTKFFADNSYDFGIIGNIYVNLGYIYSLVTNNALESQDKKEKNDIVLIDFIKSMMAGINTSIGNVATFDVFSDPIDATARIIDVNFTGNKKINPFKIEIGNNKSIVRKYNYESQIFPEQSSIIAIGAQAQGGALGSDTNTLVDFNQNLTDRIIPKKESPTSPSDEKKEQDTKAANLKTNIAIILEFINEIDADWWGLGLGQGDFDVNNSSKYANALKDIINFMKSNVENGIYNRGIIPTKLSLEIDGIGGMIIGNLFTISEDVIPKGYKGKDGVGAKIGYVVTGLGHTIQDNDWITKIDAQFIILDQ